MAAPMSQQQQQVDTSQLLNPPLEQDNYSDTTDQYTSDLFINKLNVTYLNVCGLKSKLLNPDFVDLIKKHDILFCVETKLDELDVINLPDGYSYHCKNRKKNAKRSLVV